MTPDAALCHGANGGKARLLEGRCDSGMLLFFSSVAVPHPTNYTIHCALHVGIDDINISLENAIPPLRATPLQVGDINVSGNAVEGIQSKLRVMVSSKGQRVD